MSEPEPLLVVDAHVHLHRCFGAEAGLDAAADHFRGIAGGRELAGVLMLAEPESPDGFRSVRDASFARWSLEPGPDARAQWARRGDVALLLGAGHQVPTAEGLEVLSLACAERPRDGSPLEDVVRATREAGGLAVVPWGAGKWWGRRGRALSRFLATIDDPGVFLGDNGGRPGFWRPRHFDRAERGAVRILPGSDPLPFPGQAQRVGAHGFTLPGRLEASDPVGSLVCRLLDPATQPVPFGAPERTARFVKHQLAMQRRLRLGARRR